MVTQSEAGTDSEGHVIKYLRNYFKLFQRSVKYLNRDTCLLSVFPPFLWVFGGLCGVCGCLGRLSSVRVEEMGHEQ